MTDTAPAAAPAEQPAQDVSMEQVAELLAADEAAESGAEPPEAAEAPQEPQEPPQEPQEAADQRQGGDLRVALREERERRRAAEQEAAQIKANQRLLAAAMQQLQQQIAPQQQPQMPQVPDFDSDPAGNLKYQVETVKQTLAQLAQAQQQRAQWEQQQAAQAQAEAAVVNTEAAFVAKTPDYYEALDFMRGKLAQRFETLGVPKEHVQQAVANDLWQFGLRALQAGQNPAEKVFQLAKIEGYNGPAQANSQKLSTIAQGQAASRGARSSAPASNGEMTLEAAAKLSYKELAKMSEDTWAKLMGGA
jgi:hypothetical protein